MFAYIKELLLDYAHYRLPLETRADIARAIECTCSMQEIKILDLFIQGYSLEEIAVLYVLLTEQVEALLTRILIAIAERSGYTDTLFYQRVERTGKYSKMKMQTLKNFLQAQEVFTV